MRGLKLAEYEFSAGAGIFCRAIRPAYEGIETCYIGIISADVNIDHVARSAPPMRGLKPAEAIRLTANQDIQSRDPPRL